MSHDRFHDRLLELAYGELSPKEAREAEAHAEGCAECGAELARIRATRQAMSSLPEERAPEAGERSLLAAAREAARDRTPRRLLPSWAWSASVVAALVVAVGAVSYRILAVRPAAVRPGEELLGSAQYAEPPASTPPALSADEPRAAPAPSAPKTAPSADRRAAPAPAAKRAAPTRTEVRPLADSRAAKEPPPAAPVQASPPEGKRAAATAAPSAAAREDEPSSAAQADDEAAPEALSRYAEPPPLKGEAPSRSEASTPRSRSAGAPAAASAPAAPDAAPAREVAPERDRSASASALARYTALRDAGSLSGEIRTFADCEGESWRKVERDREGRTVRYVREGRVAGRRIRVEHLFGADGALAQLRATDLDRGGTAVDPRALGLSVPRDESQASADAEPRCGR